MWKFLHFPWLEKLFRNPATRQIEKKQFDPEQARRHAVVYKARELARVSLRHGDNDGAILDMVRFLKMHGWDAPWLEDAAAEAMFNRDGKGFVEGFACDEKTALEWLSVNTL